MEKNTSYCNSLVQFSRIKTTPVKVGNIEFGGDNPIRVQSMTTTDTMDTAGSVAQAIRMIDAGCELVRYTAPSKKEAENLKQIRAALDTKGYYTPIVADIHFTPNAAEVAAQYIEKIRVNPGNYADKKKFEEIEYTDESYQQELVRIREKFTPLVLLCKANNRAMRIGTNHGSLSDRITSRYGDTANGMVASALEFIQICEDNEYYNLVVSMKSSNPLIMVQAYRMLMAEMMKRGRIYPLHLGVTEAGEGEDGRIKSAVGIGTLLEDGLGDTIRVSLTEEPEFEIPVAKKLAERYDNRVNHAEILPFDYELPYNPFEHNKRETNSVVNIGGKNAPVVVSDLSHIEELKQAHLFACGYTYNITDDKWNIKEQAVDYLFCKVIPNFELPGTLSVIVDSENWAEKNQAYPLFKSIVEFENADQKSSQLNLVRIDASDLKALKTYQSQLNDPTIVLVLSSNNLHRMAEQRRFFIEMMNLGITNPVIPYKTYANIDDESFQLYSSTDFGALLIDGMSDGIWMHTENCSTLQLNTSTAFGILQATRTRISKTDYISCPSCGRTLFDLQITTAKIRNRTNHLKGLKIGIMGCIVNGPGEMADADYGYVGVGKGKINLYKERTVVKKNVTEEEAVNELVELIKEYGDWVEPKVD
ncbi:MAG: (E)-4-hydroxy-3-methylbut-2-enyl-diphosphate synthase [Crocinitomicaceae bacterium]